MASKSTTKKTDRSQLTFPTIDPSKINNYPLPGDVIADLQDAF